MTSVANLLSTYSLLLRLVLAFLILAILFVIFYRIRARKKKDLPVPPHEDLSMPPYDIFSQWLETICTLRAQSVPHAGQTILPSIGTLGRTGAWALVEIATNPFVEIWEWNHAFQTGCIRTRNQQRPTEPTLRKVSGTLLQAVYGRFQQLAIRHDAEPGTPPAAVNNAYNVDTGSALNWQEGSLPGIGDVPVRCPNHIICPFLAPIVFRFCGGTLHNANARAFAEAHQLGEYLPDIA